MPYGTTSKKASLSAIRTDTLFTTLPPTTVTHGYVAEATLLTQSRSGTNSPVKPYTVINGHMWAPVMVKKFVKIGFRIVPRRRFRWIVSASGKRVKQFYIVHKREPVKVKTFVRQYRWVKSFENAENTFLKANSLSFTQTEHVLPEGAWRTIVKGNQFSPGSTASRSTVQFHRFPFRTDWPPEFTSWPNYLYSTGTIGFDLGDDYGFGSPYQSQFAQLDKEALFGLYTKVANELPNLLTIMAEYKEMRRTLLNIVKSGITLIKGLKNLDLARLAGKVKGVTAKDISNEWLQFQYGVLPVVNDLKAFADATMRTGRTWRKYTKKAEMPIVAIDSVPYTNSGFTFDRQFDIKLTVKYGVIISVSSSATNDPSGLLKSLGFMNPASTAYELVPFSFMLDWILPIGDYIRSASVLDNAIVLSAWKTQVTQETVYRKILPITAYASGAMISGTGSSGLYKSSYLNVRRIPMSTLPEMPRPTEVVDTDFLSLNRAINALAILVQRT